MSYSVKGYRTDAYDKDCGGRVFKDIRELWIWCREFLSEGNRKVIVYRHERMRPFHGMRRSMVKKIGEFTSPGEIPGR